MNKLYLLGNHIGNAEDTPPRTAKMLESAALVVYENIEFFEEMLSKTGIKINGTALRNQNTEAFYEEAAKYIHEGDIVLISDLGYPVIADIGYNLGRYMLAHGHEVSVIPGPSIASTAHVIALLDPFYEDFVWTELYQYNQKDKITRLSMLKDLPYNLVLVDNPDHLEETFSVIKNVFPDKPIAILFNITTEHEKVVRTNTNEAPEAYEEFKKQYPNKHAQLITMVIANN